MIKGGKVNLYVIVDRVAGLSGPIFEAVNDGVARRNYVAAMEKNNYRADYELLRIGEFDHETNRIFPEDPVPVIFDYGPEKEGI